jgi:hypothetical protein
MDPYFVIMKAATRVLTAISEHHRPEASDIEELAAYAPDLAALPPDELACFVVQRAIGSRDAAKSDPPA